MRLANEQHRLSNRLFINQHLWTVFSVIHYILTILLYGCESWTLYRHNKLNQFHVRCLRLIARIWQGSYKCSRKKIKDFSRTFPGLLLHFSSTFTGPLSDSAEYCYFEMVLKHNINWNVTYKSTIYNKITVILWCSEAVLTWQLIYLAFLTRWKEK